MGDKGSGKVAQRAKALTVKPADLSLIPHGGRRGWPTQSCPLTPPQACCDTYSFFPQIQNFKVEKSW